MALTRVSGVLIATAQPTAEGGVADMIVDCMLRLINKARNKLVPLINPENPAIQALANANVPKLQPVRPTIRIRLNPALLATLLHTLVPKAKINAELEEAKRIADEKERLALEEEAKLLAEQNAKIAAELEAKKLAEDEARIAEEQRLAEEAALEEANTKVIPDLPPLDD